MKVAEAIKQLQERYNPEDHIYMQVWSTEDVQIQAEIDGVKVTDQQADDIIDKLDNEDTVNENSDEWMIISDLIGELPDPETNEGGIESNGSTVSEM
jgi:hypothetical protein